MHSHIVGFSHAVTHMGLVTGKPVFGVSDKASFKPVSSATVTSQNIEISLVASLDMILSHKRITKVLIRLRGRIGWSAPVLFANPEDRFSRVKAHMMWLQLPNLLFYLSPLLCESMRYTESSVSLRCFQTKSLPFANFIQ